jgi:hypothetical protein
MIQIKNIHFSFSMTLESMHERARFDIVIVIGTPFKMGPFRFHVSLCKSKEYVVWCVLVGPLMVGM